MNHLHDAEASGSSSSCSTSPGCTIGPACTLPIRSLPGESTCFGRPFPGRPAANLPECSSWASRGTGCSSGIASSGATIPWFRTSRKCCTSATSRRWGSRRTSRRGNSPSFSDAFTTSGPGGSTIPPRVPDPGGIRGIRLSPVNYKEVLSGGSWRRRDRPVTAAGSALENAPLGPSPDRRRRTEGHGGARGVSRAASVDHETRRGGRHGRVVASFRRRCPHRIPLARCSAAHVPEARPGPQGPPGKAGKRSPRPARGRGQLPRGPVRRGPFRKPPWRSPAPWPKGIPTGSSSSCWRRFFPWRREGGSGSSGSSRSSRPNGMCGGRSFRFSARGSGRTCGKRDISPRRRGRRSSGSCSTGGEACRRGRPRGLS